jgi:hypothetical protein
MASIGTAVRIKTRLSLDNARESFEGILDPYSQLTKIPSTQDRILDVILEKLMLDGCNPQSTPTSSVILSSSFL